MTDQQRIALARAEQARRILDDDMVKEAFAAIEDGIVAAWKDVPMRDTEGREHLHRLLHAKRKFEAVFAAHIENGTLAANELKAEAARQSIIERAKGFIRG
jgi:predicted ArsR family transcriptional regulator